ncbi:MAG: hypothetical protein K2J80_06480 [Oscillospiraceae bacterium]|nr:hypothetical protein [Oscillospiraceae bacterium]
MKKALKKVTAVFLVVVIAFQAICTSAFAYGSSTATVSGDTGNKKISFSYTVKGKYTTLEVQKGVNGFFASKGGSYLVSFSPTSGEGTSICICDSFTRTKIVAIQVPKYFSGMPTSLSRTVDIPANTFCYIQIANSGTIETSGTFTIDRVYMETRD